MILIQIVEEDSLENVAFRVEYEDLFRASTVKLERGTSYPFARTFNFSLRATF